MLLEGEVDWTLVFAVLALIGFLLAAFFGVAAVRNGRGRNHVVTNLDQARQTAASTDRRLLEILNAIPVALVQTDIQGKFVFANRAAHQLLGRRDVELLGLRFHSATWGITFPDGRAIPPDMLPTARALRGQTVKGFQHLLANPSTRRKMLVSVTAMPILDDQDRVIGSTAAVVETEGLTTPDLGLTEVAPAPAAEDPLIRRLFDAAPEALVVVSVHGLVRDANHAALVLSDGSPLDADFADRFVAEADRVSVRQALRAALATPGSPDSVSAPGPDGRPVEWSITPLMDVRGRADALVLSGRVEAEATPDALSDEAVEQIEPADHVVETPSTDLAAADALIERQAEAGRLSAGMAQEFAGLLAVMSGAVQTMADQAEQPDKVRRLAQAALGAGRRGEGLARRMAALTAGEVSGVEQVLDIAALLRSQELRLREVVTGADLLLEVRSEPVPVLLDPTGFDAVVAALVTNAVDAGATAIAVQISIQGDRAVLRVRDNGSGMDPETARRATEAFFTTRPGHPGLGLSQASAFAEAAGGAFDLASAGGEGAEAVLSLPLVAVEAS
jgi:signal transduction histidine kinase